MPITYDALNDDYDDDLKDFLVKNYYNKSEKLDIQEINLCYNLTELEKIEN